MLAGWLCAKLCAKDGARKPARGGGAREYENCYIVKLCQIVSNYVKFSQPKGNNSVPTSPKHFARRECARSVGTRGQSASHQRCCWAPPPS